jgi:hypothetical protein
VIEVGAGDHPELFRALRARLKTRYDPANLFRMNASITSA